MFLKVAAAAITLGSGGNGGNFAPSLFVGAFLGFTFCIVTFQLGLGTLPVANFMLVGMAGILTGVFHAPLTGIFLIAEISGGYELMIPLMIVSAISYTVVKYSEQYPMDMKHLAARGEILVQDREKSILGSRKAVDLLEKDFTAVHSSMSLGDLSHIVSTSKRNIFPVVSGDGKLEGVVLLDDIREVLFRKDLYDAMGVKELTVVPAAVITPGETLYSVMKKFDETQTWYLPVLDRGKYLGFISRSEVFSEFRKLLREEQGN
jgi:CIC family chloride channel protein